MNSLILLSALMGPCDAVECTVDVAVNVEVKALPTPIRKAVRFVRNHKPVRTRFARLREAKPVRRGLVRLARRVRR